MSEPKSDGRWKTPVWLFLFFTSLYMLASPGVLNNPDAATRFLTAVSLARHGTIELDFPQTDLSRYETAQDPRGRWVELFSEGQSLLLAPLLAPIVTIRPSVSDKTLEFLTASVFFPLMSALTIPMLLIFLRLFCADDRVNLTACLLFGGCTFYLVYAYNGHQEAQVALFLILHFYWLVRHFRQMKTRYLIYAAASLGYVILLRLNLGYYGFVSAFWLITVYRRDGLPWRRTLLALGLSIGTCLLVVAPQAAFNVVKTGHALELPFARRGIRVLWHYQGSFWRGISVCLWSPGKSLFLFNPILAVSLPLFVAALARIARTPFFPVFWYAVVHAAFTFPMIQWTERGEISWGARYFAHLMFVGVMPVWFAMQMRRSRRLMAAICVAGLLGAAVQLLGTLYAPELDYGAIRISDHAYGHDPDLAWVSQLGYRADDLRHLIARAHCFVPQRFRDLPDADKYFVPQWWWARFLCRPAYGVTAAEVVSAMALLGLLLAASGWRLALLFRHVAHEEPHLAAAIAFDGGDGLDADTGTRRE